ncbi:MAG: hypothetical protein KF716_14225 [Anaerolineae bacterium]|nr:hypothetical protein [Anaerolineae bacterium]
MSQEQVNLFQSITLQAALIVAVIVLWFELKAERKRRDEVMTIFMANMREMAGAQTKLMEQTNEAQRFTINLMKDRVDEPVLPSRLPGD